MFLKVRMKCVSHEIIYWFSYTGFYARRNHMSYPEFNQVTFKISVWLCGPDNIND